MLFKDIVGQETVKHRLIHSIVKGRIGHAQLFLGPEGCGKLALAIAYAQFLACVDRGKSDACGACPSCLKFEKLIHPDLHFVYPVSTTKDVTKNPVSKDFIREWRNAVLENPYLSLSQWYERIGIENKQGIISRNESHEMIRILNLKSFESEYKAMIIWMPEKMNQVAANKVLKILEEPPPKTLFILVSENTHAFLPTVLSRTQIIKIPGINDQSMAKALNEKDGLSPEELRNIVRLANGNYLMARNLLHAKEENEVHLSQFTSMMRFTYAGKIADILQWIDDLVALGREKQKHFLVYATRMIRENFMLNMMAGNDREMIFLTDKEAAFSTNFSPFIREKNVVHIVDELNKAHANISANANSRIVLFDLCLKIMELIKMDF